MTGTCDYQKCCRVAAVERVTIGGTRRDYCARHDPLRDSRAKWAFQTPEVDP